MSVDTGMLAHDILAAVWGCWHNLGHNLYQLSPERLKIRGGGRLCSLRGVDINYDLNYTDFSLELGKLI